MYIPHREPRSFTLARFSVLTILALLFLLVLAFNIFFLLTTTVTTRQTTVEEPIAYPYVGINLYYNVPSDVTQANCYLDYRNASQLLGTSQSPVAVLANATSPNDFTRQFQAPVRSYTTYLINGGSGLTNWVPYSPGQPSYDVDLTCSIYVVTSIIEWKLGEVLVEFQRPEGISPNDPPVFSSLEDMFYLGDGQLFAIQMMVDKRCPITGSCYYERNFASTQSVVLPSASNPGGNANPSAGYSSFVISLLNEPVADGTDRFYLTVYHEEYGYPLTSFFASVFSTLFLVLFLYRCLMGHVKADPFGLVQKYFLRRDALVYVDAMQKEKMHGVDGLRNIFFGMYAKAPGVFGAKEIPHHRYYYENYKDDVEMMSTELHAADNATAMNATAVLSI